MQTGALPWQRKNEQIGAFKVETAESLRAKFSHIDQLLRYFENRTEGVRLARRADVSPAALKAFLPEICIMSLEYDASGQLQDVIMSLMGTTVASFYGEVTGKRISQYASAEVSERIMASVRKCITEKSPVVASAQSLSSAKDHLAIQVFYVPLSEDGEHIDRLFAHTRVCLWSEIKSN